MTWSNLHGYRMDMVRGQDFNLRTFGAVCKRRVECRACEGTLKIARSSWQRKIASGSLALADFGNVLVHRRILKLLHIKDVYAVTKTVCNQHKRALAFVFLRNQ
jgi:hypothetical protein